MTNQRIESIRRQLTQAGELKRQLAESSAEAIEMAAGRLSQAIKGGGKVMFCGNGGSAADSQHLAAELVVRLSASFDRVALPAIALTTDTSILTAAGNDFGFDAIFARQIEALGKPGDVLVAISTSGDSPNVIAAARAAHERKITVIALTGQKGQLAEIADLAIKVPAGDVQRIQEAHITIGHIIIALVEEDLFGG